MRVCLFTDTLGDVNGVSRFIRGVAEQAQLTGRELLVASSTRFEIPARPNLLNFPPRLATKMPRYENLELTWPPARRLLSWARASRPDAIHVSTPGPVGFMGRTAARRLGVPLLGVYHTDFPAYIDHLFQDGPLTRIAASFMGWFYRPFSRVFVRSRDYAARVASLGIPYARILALRPGIDLDAFHTRHRDESIWDRLGVPPGIKLLYVGRVSVEKGLPLLAQAWKLLHPRQETSNGTRFAGALQSPANASLVIVGDGPYRAEMERELTGRGVYFPGFRHGAELSAIYASSDAFVFPSTTDTLGQVVMEAQSSGLPVLVTDQGGPQEVVRHGGTGLILPATHAPSWTAAIERLAADSALRARMGTAAHAAMRDLSIRASFEDFWSAHQHAAANPSPLTSGAGN